MAWIVELTREEVRDALALGRHRREFAAARNLPHKVHGHDKPHDTPYHPQGGIGEKAFAVAFGLELRSDRADVEGIGSYDFDLNGREIDVKFTKYPKGKLPIQPHTNPDWYSVLVVPRVRRPGQFRLCGWIPNSAGQRDEFWGSLAGREPTWNVPQGILLDMGLLGEPTPRVLFL